MIKNNFLQMEQMKKICKVNLIQSSPSNTFKMNKNMHNNKILKLKISINNIKVDQQWVLNNQLYHPRDNSQAPTNQIIKMYKLTQVKICRELRTMMNPKKIISRQKILKILKWNQTIMALETKKTLNSIMIKMIM